MSKKNIAILGSTGSIGTQALDVIRANPDYFSVEALTAGNNADLLIQQAIEFKPNVAVIGNEKLYDQVFSELDANGKLTLNGSELEAGMYLYSLIVNGEEVSTKRMILTR